MDSKQLIKKLIRNFQTGAGHADANGGKAAKPIAEIEAYFKERLKKVYDADSAEEANPTDDG